MKRCLTFGRLTIYVLKGFTMLLIMGCQYEATLSNNIVIGTALGLRAKMNTADFQSESGKKNCFRIAREMAREGKDAISAV